MQDPKTNATLLFLKTTQPMFDKLNLTLQKDEPQIHLQQRLCAELLNDLYVKFITAEAIKRSHSLYDIEHQERKNQKAREHLLIGRDTRSYLKEMKECGMMTATERTEFYSGVRMYFVKAVDYLLLKFPLKDGLLSHAQVADVNERENASFESVEYFICRFPSLLGDSNEPDSKKVDQVEIEFQKYLVDSEIDESDARIDVKWSKMERKYPLLSKVMLGILSIPHSNADSERVFSAVTRNDTDQRPNMGNETLSSLIVHKTTMKANDTCCYKEEL